MSIVNCSVCGVPLDSDAVPEVFRKNDVVRCEWCEDNHCAGGGPPPGWEPPKWTENEEMEEP